MRRIPPTLLSAIAFLAIAVPAPAQTTNAPGGTISLARYVPSDSLFLYVEFLGTDTQGDAWDKTAAAKILRDTPTGAMLDRIATQWVAAQDASAYPSATGFRGAQTMALLEHAFKAGGMVASYVRKDEAGRPKGSGLLILRGALRPESKPLVAQFVKGLVPPGGKVQTVPRPGNRKLALVSKADGTPEGCWWVEKNEDLILADQPDSVIAALDGKAPSLADDPAHAELLRSQDGFRPLVVASTSLDHWPDGQTTKAGELFGRLDMKGVQRLEFRFGTQGEALMHEVRIVAPAPRSGTMALFDQPKLDPAALPPMPEGVLDFAVFTIEPLRVWDHVVGVLKNANPDGENRLQQAEAAFKARTKLRLRQDILGRLGPRIVVYGDPKSKPGGLGFQVPKVAVLIEIQDPKAVGTTLDQLMIVANKEIKAKMAPPADAEPAGRPGRRGASSAPPAPEFRVTGANPKTYSLNLPSQFAALTNLRLTVAAGKHSLVIATQPEAAKEALAAEAKPSDKGLSDEVARAIEGLPEGPTMLAVSDPRETLPEGLAKLPETINALLAMSAMPGAPNGGPPPPAPPASGGKRPQATPGGGGGDRGREGGGGDGPPTMIGNANLLQTPPTGPVTIRIAPAQIPSADAIRPLLFPAASALAVDDQSIRFVSRYAFPDIAGMLTGVAASRGLPALMSGQGLPPGMVPPGPNSGPGRPGAPGAGGNVGGNAAGGRVGGARPD